MSPLQEWLQIYKLLVNRSSVFLFLTTFSLSQTNMPSTQPSILHFACPLSETQSPGPVSQSESPYFVKPERLIKQPLGTQQLYHATSVIPSVKRRQRKLASLGSSGPEPTKSFTPFAASQNHSVSAIKSFKIDSDSYKSLNASPGVDGAAIDAHQGNIDTAFERCRFTSNKIGVSSQWKPASCPNSSKASTNLTRITTIKGTDLYSLEPYALVGFQPVSAFTASFPELKNIAGIQDFSLFQAAYLTQQDSDPKAGELVHEVAYTEFVNANPRYEEALAADAAFASSPRAFFDLVFDNWAAEYMEPEGGVAASRVRTALVQSSITPASAGSNDECKSGKKSRCIRFGAALCRMSHRWSARAQRFRDHWRERRELRESRRQVRRQIKIKKRSIALLEKEKRLAELNACVLEVSHKRYEEHKDHQQAAYHRQLAAQLANKRRQMELLEHQAALTQTTRKSALNQPVQETLSTGAEAKPPRNRSPYKKFPPPVSVTSPGSSKESLLKSRSSEASPSRSSISGAAVALNLLPNSSALVNQSQSEENFWDGPWLLKVPLVIETHAKDRFLASGPAFRDRFSRCLGFTYRPLQREIPQPCL